MEVLVNANTLSDAPYKGEENSICSFNDEETNNFVNELIHGNQTCYLVSGYRGVGKTSFIHRVKQLVELKTLPSIYQGNKRIEPESKEGLATFEPVFVYTSYAKYNNQTAFLRQLIRNLFLTFDERMIEGKSRSSFLTKGTLDEFQRLNVRTFFDIKTQFEIAKERITETKVDFSSNLDCIQCYSMNSKAMVVIPFRVFVKIILLFKFFFVKGASHQCTLNSKYGSELVLSITFHVVPTAMGRVGGISRW